MNIKYNFMYYRDEDGGYSYYSYKNGVGKLTHPICYYGISLDIDNFLIYVNFVNKITSVNKERFNLTSIGEILDYYLFL